MNRKGWYDYIEDRIIGLYNKIEIRGKLNLLDLHLHSENFYCHFLNALYGWQLINANDDITQNVEAIDLIDNTNKIFVQVSATSTKKKIENSLAKDLLKEEDYNNFRFKFISIAKDASNLRKNTYNKPATILFEPASDIYDRVSILRNILNLETNHLENIYKLIKSELGKENEVIRVESNISAIINLLAKENLNNNDWLNINNIDFNINNKVVFNQLKRTKRTIDDYKIYYRTIDKIYAIFDQSGNNKSLSVLNKFRSIYIHYSTNFVGDELFDIIIKKVVEQVQESSNFDEIAIEELEMCVGILAVDAFIRCKIFENPNIENNAIA